MLKGVNKHVVEVVDFDNEYFERAILFVKAGKQGKEEDTLRENAHRYLGSIRYRPHRLGTWRYWLRAALQWGGAMALGALAAALLIK